jgi:hypothetical protein
LKHTSLSLWPSCHGIAFSFVYATAIGTDQKWFRPEYRGLIASLGISGYAFGSLVWVPIQTVFVNPTNFQAEIDNNCTFISFFIFADEDLLERVPWMFVLLGCLYLVLGFLAFLFIYDPAQDNINLKIMIDPKH